MTELLFTIVIFISMFIQAVTGFGGPLLAMPLAIVISGVTLSKPVVTICAWIAGALVAVPMWKEINWKEMWKMTGIMLIGVIAGMWVFETVNMSFLLILYAVVVFGIGVKKMFFPSNGNLPKSIQYTCLGAAGIMQGLFISGGSFLVVYALERLKEKSEFRATLSAVWTLLNTYIIATYVFNGILTPPVLKLTGIVIIPELIAIFLAGKFTKKLNQTMFLKVTYAILIVSGIVLFINSMTS